MHAAGQHIGQPIDPTSRAKLAESGLRYDTLDTSDEAAYSAWARADLRGFLAEEPGQKQLDGMRAALGYRRTTGVWDDTTPVPDEPVATVSSWPAELTVPGGARLTSWAISSVTVSQTHRRRGIARCLLEGELRTAAALGVAVAALTVSESTIYGRFGFGPATFAASYRIDTRRVRWAGPAARGRVDHVPRERWAELIGELYDRVRGTRAGEIEAWPGMWPRMAGTSGDDDGAGKKLRAVSYTSPEGVIEGAALYKYEGGEEDYASHTLQLEFLRTASDEAAAALWRFLLEADLVSTLKAEQLAVDEPLRWMLGDQRAATVTTTDHQWLRILDTRVALESRRFAGPGHLAIEVDDELGFAGGRFMLDVDTAGVGAVSEVGELPEGTAAIRLGVDALGSLLLGGVSPSALCAAGTLSEAAAGGVALAARLFRTSPEPAPGIWY